MKFYEVDFNGLGMGEEKEIIFTDKDEAVEFQELLDNHNYLTNFFTYEVEKDSEDYEKFESRAEWDASQLDYIKKEYHLD